MKHVVLYARVSTANGQQDPEMQLSEIREYALRRGLIVVSEYVDRISTTESRPALNRLMVDAKQRKFAP
jgi:DNA invertase Pin-like site-specific DNA recombinase